MGFTGHSVGCTETEDTFPTEWRPGIVSSFSLGDLCLPQSIWLWKAAPILNAGVQMHCRPPKC